METGVNIMSDTQEQFLPGSTPSSNLSRCKPNCLCICLVISLLISIALGTLVVCIMIKPILREPIKGGNGTICFTCDYVGSRVESSDTLYNLVRTDNNTFCCLRGKNELSNAVIQMINRRQDNKGDTTVSSLLATLKRSRQPIGAHLYLNEYALLEGRLSWSEENSNSLSYRSGVSYKSGFLNIPSPGRYLIYSHITYKRRTLEDKGQDSFVHRITRQHPRQPNLGEVTLLYNRNSYSSEKTTGYSFLSAVLFMRRNDQLAVRVSDLCSISSEPLISYFGLLKL